MRNYTLLFLVSLLLTIGCRKEIDLPQTGQRPEIFRQVTKTQNITAVDGTVTESSCTIETLASGELYQICKPAFWNGKLVLYAHGYVSPYEPTLSLPDETEAFIPGFQALGFAVATTSFSENGLAIQSGINSIIALRQRFVEKFGEPKATYLAGGSEGAVIATLTIEQHPELFSGGMPLCGPCGSFQRQINYFGDFRVLFDYFFPQVLPGTVVDVPTELATNWSSVYVPRIKNAIASNPSATIKLLNTAQAAYVSGDQSSITQTVIGLLWYSAFATNDARAKLGGNAFDNSDKLYFGTGSFWGDYLLNRRVQRYTSDPTARQTVRNYYETSGEISRPLVSAHTTQDPTIPFWHLALYTAKTISQGAIGNFIGVPVDRYGHCNFTEAEIASSFALLVLRVEGETLTRAEKLVTLSSATGGKIVQSVRTD